MIIHVPEARKRMSRLCLHFSMPLNWPSEQCGKPHTDTAYFSQLASFCPPLHLHAPTSLSQRLGKRHWGPGAKLLFCSYKPQQSLASSVKCHPFNSVLDTCKHGYFWVPEDQSTELTSLKWKTKPNSEVWEEKKKNLKPSRKWQPVENPATSTSGSVSVMLSMLWPNKKQLKRGKFTRLVVWQKPVLYGVAAGSSSNARMELLLVHSSVGWGAGRGTLALSWLLTCSTPPKGHGMVAPKFKVVFPL